MLLRVLAGGVSVASVGFVSFSGAFEQAESQAAQAIADRVNVRVMSLFSGEWDRGGDRGGGLRGDQAGFAFQNDLCAEMGL